MRRKLATMNADHAAKYARAMAKTRVNMTVAERKREGERIFGKVPTAKELAMRLGVSHLVHKRV